MTPEFAYFLKVNVAFALFYAFYRLFFYKDTFFKLRRSVLLAFFGLALWYPFLNIQDWIREQEPIVEVILIYSSLIDSGITITMDEVSPGTDWTQWIIIGIWLVYWAGVIVFAIRFLVQLGSILWLAHKSLKQMFLGTIVHVLDKPAGPFSFFHLIFIYPQSHSEKEAEEILAHEGTHVSQWHSLDVILSEMISIFCWFNPFVWLLKREVRHNLEYLADNQVIERGYDSKSYQYHLLGLAHQHKEGASLYNSFNVLHLKNRIGMMNKRRSRGIDRTKYLFFIPLVGLLMLISNMEAFARVTRQMAKDLATVLPGQLPFPELELLLNEENMILPVKVPDIPEISPAVTTNNNIAEEHTVFTVVEQMPEFPGGEAALLHYIRSNVRYPVEAFEKNEQGRVISSFVITADGNIDDPQVVESVSRSLDAEALRIIRNMPKWKPGKMRGDAVSVRYTLPVNFALDDTESSSSVFTVVEQMPKYPGGDAALLKYISQSIKYPVFAQENGIQGRVTVSFIVNTDGSVTDAEVIRGVSPELDKEALRVIRGFERWEPGKQRGKPVRVKYTVPIQFRLQ